MPNILQSIVILALIISLQIAVYLVFLRPLTSKWGATKAESTMPLIGDNLAPIIDSTRAITINAPVSEVWQWIIQFGADRGGFFSYALIEKALGYEARTAEPIPEFKDMPVGRIIPTSIDESKSLIKYDFRVVAVDPGISFVIENWGAFVLKMIDDKRTRFIVRTHGQESPNWPSKIGNFLGMAAHYIMERRMMLGFKAQAEAGAGVHLSALLDNLWLLGILLSALGILAIVFLETTMLGVLLATIYNTFWLLVFMIFEPKPRYSIILFLVISATIAWFL